MSDPAPVDPEALRRLLDEATPAPWKIECDWEYTTDEERLEDHPECDCRTIVGGTGDDHMRIYDEGGHDHADAALIVAMHAALPGLLAAVDVLRDAREEIRAAWESEGISFSEREDSLAEGEPNLLDRIDALLGLPGSLVEPTPEET